MVSATKERKKSKEIHGTPDQVRKLANRLEKKALASSDSELKKHLLNEARTRYDFIGNTEDVKRLDKLLKDETENTRNSTYEKAKGVVEFRTVEGDVRISKSKMTQAEGIRGTEAMKDYHMATRQEISVLAETNHEVRQLLIKDNIVTADRGLDLSGACKRYVNGELEQLSKRPWIELTDKERDTFREELLALPMKERAWAQEGPGPVVLWLDHWHGNALGVSAFFEDHERFERSWIVWAPDAPKHLKQRIKDLEKHEDEIRKRENR
jgi:hypothetical protein